MLMMYFWDVWCVDDCLRVVGMHLKFLEVSFGLSARFHLNWGYLQIGGFASRDNLVGIPVLKDCRYCVKFATMNSICSSFSWAVLNTVKICLKNSSISRKNLKIKTSSKWSNIFTSFPSSKFKSNTINKQSK